jgi:hypothetical protein
MNTRRLLLGLGVALVAPLLLLGSQETSGTTSALAAVAPAPHGPRVALLATFPGALHTSLYLVHAGETAPPAPVATFGHLPDATVRAALIPGTTTALVTADTTPTRDASFNASLFRLAPHTPPETLVDRVVHASRPLVTPAGRVFVARGVAGPELDGKLRVDALTIDEIDISTGAARTVHAVQGHLTFLAGLAGHELVVYRVLPGHADIVAIDPDTGAVRPVLSTLPPFARDFSIDAAGARLVFQNRHEADSRTWVIDEVTLANGKTRRLYQSASMTMAPALLPGGGVLFNPDGAGLHALDTEAPLRGPLGPGVDVHAGLSADGAHLLALHTVAGALPVPFVIETKSGAASVLPAPSGARIAIAGILPGEGGAR